MPDATPSWLSVVLPIITLLIGYGTKSISDWIEYKRTTERDREMREAVRRGQMLERRISFQRETLLELQEISIQLARSIGAMHHQDIIAHHKTGKWQKQLYPNDLDEAHRLAQARTTVLGVRVRDELVRELLAQFKQSTVEVTGCGTENEARQHMTDMGSLHDALNERIGEMLRKLDDDESR